MITELSSQEKDYIDTLPEELQRWARYELLEYQPERMEDFINYLRISCQPFPIGSVNREIRKGLEAA